MEILRVVWRNAAAPLLIGMALLGAPPAWGQEAAEYQVKAVLLYNLTRFTTWPAERFQGHGEFRLCVYGEDRFQGSLDLAVRGESVNGLPVRLHYPGGVDDIAGCHLLFVGAGETRPEYEVLAAVAAAPILTVGESEGFIFNGGMVRFYTQGSKIRFAINPDAVTAAGLKVSANLLYIATIVRNPALANRSEP
jgi:preprotein translocase subunit Sec61beta